jgi:hypothetical protein
VDSGRQGLLRHQISNEAPIQVKHLHARQSGLCRHERKLRLWIEWVRRDRRECSRTQEAQLDHVDRRGPLEFSAAHEVAFELHDDVAGAVRQARSSAPRSLQVKHTLISAIPLWFLSWSTMVAHRRNRRSVVAHRDREREYVRDGEGCQPLD